MCWLLCHSSLAPISVILRCGIWGTTAVLCCLGKPWLCQQGTICKKHTLWAFKISAPFPYLFSWWFHVISGNSGDVDLCNSPGFICANEKSPYIPHLHGMNLLSCQVKWSTAWRGKETFTLPFFIPYFESFWGIDASCWRGAESAAECRQPQGPHRLWAARVLVATGLLPGGLVWGKAFS